MSAQPATDLPALPDAIDSLDESELSAFAGTLVRLGDAAGSTPTVRVQLVADGVLARIAQLLRQRSDWLLQRRATSAADSSDSRQVDVVAQCLRVCGNSCIDCDVARDALLQHAALPAILACLRSSSRADVLKFAAGALANLVCAHDAAQRAFMASHATNVLVPALNNTVSRIRAGQAHNDDYVLCKLIIRIYINLAASTPATPPSLTDQYHAHVLAPPLLPALLGLGRLFVVAVSDQPDPDDRTLVLDLVTLCRALSPALVVGSEHGELVTLVMDASKRQDERVQQLSLSTLCEWARCSPRVLPFLSSRLHSTFPSLQLAALDVWLRLTTDCEDGEVLEAALKAVPLFVGLASSKRADVADRAMRVVVNVAAQKEAREQMWRTKGFVKAVRLQLTGRPSPLAAVRLLRCMSLSPELAEAMWKEGVVDDALHLLHSAQQRAQSERKQQRQREEKVALEADAEQQLDCESVDTELQSSLCRYLRNLVSVKVETDGTDDAVSNERWEGRQWATMHSTVSVTLIATHTATASHIVVSPCFPHLVDATPPVSALTTAAAGLLAALIAALGGERPSATASAASRLAAATPAVLPLLTCLARSSRFEDQHAAAGAYRCLVEASKPQSTDATSDVRQSVLHNLLQSGSVHVVSTATAVLMELRQRDAEWRWDSAERQVLAAALECWMVRVRRQQAEEDLSDPSDEFIMLTKLQQMLQQLNESSAATNSSSTETSASV